jgi:hypothetical protein
MISPALSPFTLISLTLTFALQFHLLWQNDVIHKRRLGMTSFKNIDLSYMGDVKNLYMGDVKQVFLAPV